MSDVGILNGLVHIWGIGGSGKTLLCSAIAAKRSREGHVLWLCLDGKYVFMKTLRNMFDAYGGFKDNLTILVTQDPADAIQTLLTLRERLRDDTKTIVIDPITRVLHMGRRDGSPWGRELIEEVLPTIVSLSLSRGITIVATNQIRELDGNQLPVHHAAIKKWADIDLQLNTDGSPDAFSLHDNERDRCWRFRVANNRLSFEEEGVVL